MTSRAGTRNIFSFISALLTEVVSGLFRLQGLEHIVIQSSIVSITL